MITAADQQAGLCCQRVRFRHRLSFRDRIGDRALFQATCCAVLTLGVIGFGQPGAIAASLPHLLNQYSRQIVELENLPNTLEKPFLLKHAREGFPKRRKGGGSRVSLIAPDFNGAVKTGAN